MNMLLFNHNKPKRSTERFEEVSLDRVRIHNHLALLFQLFIRARETPFYTIVDQDYQSGGDNDTAKRLAKRKKKLNNGYTYSAISVRAAMTDLSEIHIEQG